MTERTRYRVTGGIFLFALAIILAPMLFDGTGLEPVEPPAVPQPRDGAAPGTLPQAAPQPGAGEEQLVEPFVMAEAQALREAIDEKGFDRQEGTRIGDAVLTAPEDGAGDGPAWAVQLASFAERGNALALRERLREDGYEAILSDAREGSASSARVAIGPILSREDAVELQHELSQRYELAPIVVELGP